MNPILIVVFIIFICMLENTINIYLLFSIIIGIIYYFNIFQTSKGNKYNTKWNATCDTKWKRFNEMTQNKVVYSNSIYNIHKGPNKLKYIFMHKNLKSILEDIDFILKYQQDIFLDIIIYIEYFLKIHYYIIIGKYDTCTYIPILKDIQKHIVILLSTTVFNLPNKSQIVDIQDIDTYINKKTLEIKAILDKYMTILKHKYYKQCNHQFNLIEYDESSKSYEIVP